MDVQTHNLWVKQLTEAARSGKMLDLEPYWDDESLRASFDTRRPFAARMPALALREVLLNPELNPDPRGLRIRGAHVEGKLDFRYAKLPCPLQLSVCLISAGADFSNCSIPELDLGGSRCLGLSLEQAQVHGALYAEKLMGEGELWAVGMHITGPLGLQDAKLINSSGDALRLDGALLAGGVFANGLITEGAVQANGARIIGPLVLTCATLNGAGGVALCVDRTEIEGGLYAEKLAAEGEVRGLGTNIAGQLNLKKAALINPNEVALNLETATIGTFFLDGDSRIEGSVLLVGAEVANLATGKRCPKRDSFGSWVTTGWKLGDVHGWLRDDVRAVEDWLLSSSSVDEFIPQPWHELATVYDRIGHTTAARRLRYGAARHTARCQPYKVRIIQFFYRWLVGYGYYPLRTLWWFMAAFLIALNLSLVNAQGFSPVRLGDAQAAYDATQSAQGVKGVPGSVTGATRCEDLGGQYPCLRPWSFAAATVTPASALHSPAWAPSLPWLEATLMALKFLGWILTAFLLAGLTGLLRKT